MQSTQSIVVGVCSIICLLILFTNSILNQSYTVKEKAIAFVVIFFVGVPFLLLQVYTVNCVVVGTCDIYGWIITSIAIITTLTYLGLFVYKIVVKKQQSYVTQEIKEPAE